MRRVRGGGRDVTSYLGGHLGLSRRTWGERGSFSIDLKPALAIFQSKLDNAYNTYSIHTFFRVICNFCQILMGY